MTIKSAERKVPKVLKIIWFQTRFLLLIWSTSLGWRIQHLPMGAFYIRFPLPKCPFLKGLSLKSEFRLTVVSPQCFFKVFPRSLMHYVHWMLQPLYSDRFRYRTFSESFLSIYLSWVLVAYLTDSTRACDKAGLLFDSWPSPLRGLFTEQCEPHSWG